MSSELRLTVFGGLVALAGVALLLDGGTDPYSGERTSGFWFSLVLAGIGAVIVLVGAIRLGRAKSPSGTGRLPKRT